jgi:beta-galactosidase/beta-glucuronidase
MVQRDRNHPSIICWSIGNEVMERKDIRVITTARNLKKDYLEGPCPARCAQHGEKRPHPSQHQKQPSHCRPHHPVTLLTRQ